MFMKNVRRFLSITNIALLERICNLYQEKLQCWTIFYTFDHSVKVFWFFSVSTILLEKPTSLLLNDDQVLWLECGWQPVSLTDLITGASVKKAYRKATLCIHPDKVQQKGANLQQKYIAEKVFDLLKVLLLIWYHPLWDTYHC